MTTSNPEPLTMTIADAGVLLGVGRSTAYALVKAGELSAIKIRRTRRVTRAAIDAYLADRAAA